MRFFNADGISKRSFIILFILKLFFGFALWAIYTFYYTERVTADIYKYFDDSKVIFDCLKTNPADYFKMLFGIKNNTHAFDHYYSQMNFWAQKSGTSIYNDSHTIIRFNALVRLFSFGYYNVHTVVICFLSLIGLTAIYKTFVIELQDKKQELLFAEIEIKQTSWGHVAAMMFKPEQLKAIFRLDDGSIREYRLIASMAKAGFLISPLIETTQEFFILYQNPKALTPKKVRSLIIVTENKHSWQWNNQYLIRFRHIS